MPNAGKEYHLLLCNIFFLLVVYFLNDIRSEVKYYLQIIIIHLPEQNYFLIYFQYLVIL